MCVRASLTRRVACTRSTRTNGTRARSSNTSSECACTRAHRARALNWRASDGLLACPACTRSRRRERCGRAGIPEGGRVTMKKSSLVVALVLLVSNMAFVVPAGAQPDVVLRDTTGFPAPDPGMARIVVVRERQLRQDPKPEFVYVDRTPVGVIQPKTGVTVLVPAGMHKVWLGRGLNVATWVNAAAGGRYLLRMREVIVNGTWYADFIMDSAEGYADFAVANGFKLAVSGPGSMGSLERNLQKVKNDPKADSLARERAIARATPPIQVTEMWYQDLEAPPANPLVYEHSPGRLVLDDAALRFTRGDTLALDIPRSTITAVRYGGTKDDRPNAWIKIAYTENGVAHAVAFTCTRNDSATVNYNRLFSELTKQGQ